MTASTEAATPVQVSSPGVQSSPAGPETEANASAGARARETTRAAAQSTLKQVRRVTGRGILDARPKTVREQWAYARAGGWIPGERAAWLEAFGKVYGFAVAVPVTSAAFIAVWFIQRPTRLVFGALLYMALRWAL